MDEYRAHIADLLPPVAIKFFATFSRFEFALKRGDFLKGDVGKNAEPDWDRFAKTLGEPFFQHVRSAREATIFFEAPPKALKVTPYHTAEFSDAPPVTNAETLFVSVRRVRNNLFHGEKLWIGDRNERLMRAGLFVLDLAMSDAAAVEPCKKVLRAFRESFHVGSQ